MTHPALNASSVAVITGGATGIGLACACRLGAHGMKIVIADLGPDRLAAAARTIREAGATEVMTSETDVSDPAALKELEAEVARTLGGADILMNNAGVQPGSAVFGPVGNWQQVLGVNLWGVIFGTQVFGPGMIARGRPGLIINTGSKQGITTPPGDPAYNVSKSGVKAFTEALQHELRCTKDCQITAHLLIPGFVDTNLTGRAKRTEKPAAAWTPEQTADFMIDSLNRGDFYILCPDNDVPRALDEKRMSWAIGDIIHNRPPLSRWHPDYSEAFADFLAESLP